MKNILVLIFFSALSVFLRAEQQITQAQVNGLAASLAAAGGSTDLTASWSLATTNVVINGDSVANRMGTRFANLAGITGKANCFNTGVNGRSIESVAGSYAGECAQFRPFSNGGSTAGITTSWMFLLDGGGGAINSVSAGEDSATYIAALQTFINVLVADGWHVAVVTCHWGAGFYQQGSTTLVTPLQARYINEINLYIMRLRGQNPNVYAIDSHSFITGPNDPLNDPDKIHLSSSGGEDGSMKQAELLYAFLKAGAGSQLPYSGLKGVNSDDILTNNLFELAPHATRGFAQVQAPVGLLYAASMTWDVSTAQNGVVVLSGDVTVTPVNMVPNGLYSFKIRPNSHTVTFDATRFKFPPNAEMPSGGKETDTSGTSGVVYDQWFFWSDGYFLHRDRRLVINSTRPVSSGAILEDYFLSDGVQESMSGRRPDTQVVSTNTWIADGPSVISATGDYLTGTHNIANNNARYDIAIHDGYSAEWDLTEIPEGGSGTDNTIGQLFLFRFDSTVDPKTHACMALKVTSDGAHTPHFFWYANGYLADAGVEVAGSGTSINLNDHLKVTVNGSTLQLIRTPSGGSPSTLIPAASSSNGNASGKNAVGFDFGVNTGGSTGNTFFSNGPVKHLLVKSFP